MEHIKSYKEFINESLKEESPYSDSEIRKKVVEPILGKDYEVFIMSKDNDYQRQLDDIKKSYNVKDNDWAEAGWTKIDTLSNAWTCPEKEIITASILNNGEIVGALYMKAEKVKK